MNYHLIMGYYFTNAQLITALVVLVFLVVVAAVGFVHHRRTRTRVLRNRFGSRAIFDELVQAQKLQENKSAA